MIFLIMHAHEHFDLPVVQENIYSSMTFTNWPPRGKNRSARGRSVD
jgi:hypothetical protein